MTVAYGTQRKKRVQLDDHPFAGLNADVVIWVERPRTTIAWRSCKKSSSDAKVHAKAELFRSDCSTLPPNRAEAGYARSCTVDTHHTENKCGGRVVVGPDRLANIPSSPTGVRQRNTGFFPA